MNPYADFVMVFGNRPENKSTLELKQMLDEHKREIKNLEKNYIHV